MKSFYYLFLFSLVMIISCKKDDDKAEPKPRETRIVTLQNDSYTSTSLPVYSSNPNPEQEVSVVLGPAEHDFKVTAVQFLLGGSSEPEECFIECVISPDNGTADPGNINYYYCTTYMYSSNDSLCEIIFPEQSWYVIQAGTKIRISLYKEPLYSGSGLPAIAIDNDGVADTSKNWYFDWFYGWVSSSSVGYSGDFIIRAVIEEEF